MKSLLVFPWLLACAGTTAPAPTTPCPEPTVAAAPPASTAPVLGGPAVRPLEVAAAGAGEPREVKVLVDEPLLKLVKIVLRGGTVLPEHHSEFPVTIQAIHGSGTIMAGEQELKLDAAHPVMLAAKVPHAVTPDPGSDLVVLVHHLRGGAAATTAPHGHEGH